MNTPLLYVAGAYSGNTLQNIQEAEAVSINLIRNGFHVITPHKNTSGYEKYEGDGITYETWMAMDTNILSRCDALYLMQNGYASKGANIELEFAKNNKIPVIHQKHHPSLTITTFRELYMEQLQMLMVAQ